MTTGSLALPGHDVPLGRYTTVRRLLPHRERRMVGAWCFADHFGPDDVSGRPGMRIAPHPHTGLQTVTWLVEGQIHHRDSLGSDQRVRPGQLNLMTSGHGIAHSEQSPPDHGPVMHGLQLWVALPSSALATPPRFTHHQDLPGVRVAHLEVTVVIGSLARATSPALVHTPLLGAELAATSAGRAELPLDASFEHAVLVMSGTAVVGGTSLAPGSLLYLGTDRTSVTVETPGGARLFLLGGEPFEEPLVMWWNFVGRTHEDIVEARDRWMAERASGFPSDGARFGAVAACDEEALPAPEMPTVRLKARDRHGVTH